MIINVLMDAYGRRQTSQEINSHHFEQWLNKDWVLYEAREPRDEFHSFCIRTAYWRSQVSQQMIFLERDEESMLGAINEPRGEISYRFNKNSITNGWCINIYIYIYICIYTLLAWPPVVIVSLQFIHHTPLTYWLSYLQRGVLESWHKGVGFG